MENNKKFDNLQQILVFLYQDTSMARTIISKAQINSDFINYKEGRIGIFWNDSLVEIAKQEKLEDLVILAADEYSQHEEELHRLLLSYQGTPPQKFTVVTSPDSEVEIPPAPTEHVQEDLGLQIGKKKHWDRDLPTRIFLRMIRREPGYPYHILAIQAPEEAHLYELLSRYVDICKELRDMPPLLYARVNLASDPDPQALIPKIITHLKINAEKSEDRAIRNWANHFNRVWDEITNASDRSQLRGHQLARKLNDCLKDVVKQHTIVLLLDNFQQNVGWLKSAWFTQEASKLDGLVIVVYGIENLSNLEDDEGIYCISNLSNMSARDFFEWAYYGYGFDWFTEEMAKSVHEKGKGNIGAFADFLEYTSMVRS